MEFGRIWGKSPSFASAIGSKSWVDRSDWKSERGRLLSSELSKRLDSKCSIHVSPSHAMGMLSHSSFSTLGFSIVQEAATVFPLRSQQADGNAEVGQGLRTRDNSDQQERMYNREEKKITLQNVLEMCSAGSGHPEMEKYLGREPLQKRVWPLGDLPCIAFTVQDFSADHAASPNIMKQLDTQEPSSTTISKHIEPDDFSYTYSKRSVGGLSLPADIQIIFMSSPGVVNDLHQSVQPITDPIPNYNSSVDTDCELKTLSIHFKLISLRVVYALLIYHSSCKKFMSCFCSFSWVYSAGMNSVATIRQSLPPCDF